MSWTRRSMLLATYLLLMIRSVLVQQLNVYHMYHGRPVANESAEQSIHDCLYYYVKDDIMPHNIQYDIHKYDDKSRMLPQQIIQYCYRPLEKLPSHLLHYSNTLERITYTFEQLQNLNVTSEQLYVWSAPIDLVEQYESYLIENGLSNQYIFHNCTSGWFGPLCQYSFGFVDKSLSFSEVVKTTFQLKENQKFINIDMSEIFSNLSCYMHLSCNRGGPFPACLDWREICDGKVDCIDGGLDEQDCVHLEINECNENEYRCYNGQCISEEFLWDMSYNPECLDGTDEVRSGGYTQNCPYDPSFRCEELMWQRRTGMEDVAVVCGDGSYIAYLETCHNKRNVLLKKAMIQSTVDVSSICRDAMACYTGIGACTTKVNVAHHCPESFQFPGVPVLFGHVKLLYKNDSFDAEIQSGILLPTHVCYDASLCPFPSLVSVANYSACWPFEALVQLFIDKHYSRSWDLFMRGLTDIFYGCAVIADTYCRYNHTLYTCNLTTKCISKHRLVDGITDCLLKDDEDFQDSCSLTHSKHRRACGNTCLSPIVIDVFKSYCPHGEYRLSPYFLNTKENIRFQSICDGYVDLFPLPTNGQNHTDESECDLWPCSNSYTRCDGIWHCHNGEDEMNCPWSTCPLLENIWFTGANIVSFNKRVEKSVSTILDCHSSLKEQLVCQNWTHYFNSDPDWCTTNRKCLQPTLLCVDKPKCIFDSNETFCRPPTATCSADYVLVQTSMKRFFCYLNTVRKPSFIPLALKHSRVYPAAIHISIAETDSNATEQRYTIRENTRTETSKKDLAWLWRCNRGLSVSVRLANDKYDRGCLCPPSYYGDLCQYQNQRVSLTLLVRVSSNWKTVFAIILTLIDNDEQIINSYDQIQYSPIHDCNTKFNVYLLYSTRPKNISQNYSVRIDVFNKYSLEYRASWLFPILFPFLPVNRMILQIAIPFEPSVLCHLNCNTNSQCSKYENTETYFCRCKPGWSGSQCDFKHVCDCSSDALCVSPSFCLCPLGKFGHRCYLKIRQCQFDSCMNGGTCIPSDVRIAEENIFCICREGFSGDHCQFIDSRIVITFHDVTIPAIALVHFISISSKDKVRPHTRTTTFKKIGIYDHSIVIFRTVPFHIAFIEMYMNYYLIVLQENYIPSRNISTDVIPSHRCLHIRQLFNETLINLHLIRRIKHYHHPCQQHPDLACFYDDTQMCVCNSLQHANCFEFNHKPTHNCRGLNYCQNSGQCFQDDPYCPTTSACYCPDCYYGSRCQIPTIGFSLSLDIILGYHILPNIRLLQQPLVTQISAVIAMVIVLTGLVSSLLSIITFENKSIRDTGCGVYIFMSSLTSLFTMFMLTLKFWFLVISQMTRIANRSLLQFNCSSIDFLLRVFLLNSDWLNACVTIERAIIVAKGANFNKLTSRQIAKWIILLIIFFVTLTSIQDPIHRHLVDDEDDQRIWCTTKYAPLIHNLDSIMILFHSLIPFVANILSALMIIILPARRRSEAAVQKPTDDKLLRQFHEQLRKQFYQNLRKQFQAHKHILISSCILVVLAIPRLIITFLSGCMISARNPWLFLVGYFISFVPSALIFAIFVLPSTAYKRQFRKALKRIRHKFDCR